MAPHDTTEGVSLALDAGDPSCTHGAPDLLLSPLPSKPSHSSAESLNKSLPRIQGNKRQLREVTQDALQALIAANDPPTVFQRGSLFTRLRIRPETGAPFLEPLTIHALRGHLARIADWLVARSIQEELVLEDGAPPMAAVRDLASLPDWAGVPMLRAVVECPTFTREGTLVAKPGYHPSAGLWYFPRSDLHLPPVSDQPSREELDRAKQLLLEDLLGDFPFQDTASRAHALAAVLLPFGRALIPGPTPLHTVDAPLEGTGKSLLTSCIAIVATGRPAEATPEATSEEEWRKRIGALLCEGASIILLDNLNHTLKSGALASVLTATMWKDRILSRTKTLLQPNFALWLATGNNLKLSRELIRRTLWIRLDARVDAPWERTGFQHPNLIGWATANRGQLVWAALTLCQAWLAAGKPAGRQTLGMFEGWVETMGGILDVAGVPGLLANAQEFRKVATDQASEWRAFVVAWWQEHHDGLVGVADLYTLAVRNQLLDSVLGDKGDKSQRTLLGLALGKVSDRVCGEYRVERGDEDHKGRQQYRLQYHPPAVRRSEYQPGTARSLGEPEEVGQRFA